ncbi:DUF6641 family protein [Qipengyuania sp.]|uniref:DUF6641 family protein n=1 Tax=Qipengyuania sp. TaxID=2004515 RepID=UPI0037367F08
MTILKTLKLAAATPASQGPSEFSFRDKMLGYLNEQKALAKAEMTGTEFSATRIVTRKNEAGERIRVEAPRRVRKGWFTDADGKMFFQLRYGNRPVELSKGKNAVEVEGLAEIPAVIGSIIDAIDAGELDAQLTAARDARRANFKSTAKKPN